MRRLFLIAILLCWHVAALATVSTEVSQSSVKIGETFRIIFTMDALQSSSIPDLTSLQQNFDIIGTERSIAYSNVNGQTNSVHQWIVLLKPKKTGMLLIPSIQFGSQQSTASSIDVTGNQVATTSDSQNDEPHEEVMLKTKVSQHELFVNQQVIYTVKLYNRQRLMNAEYQPPRVEDALMIPLGELRRYETTVNGNNFMVEEQQYAIFPQKSGELNIIAPTFKALVFDAVPRRVEVNAKKIKLMVKPIPAEYSGKDWLPAKQVALTETYDHLDATMKQGSTLVRIVTLQAAGIPAQLLPGLALPNSPQFSSYPEKPELQNTAREQELIGRSDTKVTYLLNNAGQITIPAMHVPWFNIDTGKEEIVSLPARIINVKAKGGVGKQTAVAPPTTTKQEPVLQPTKQLPTLPIEKSNGVAWWMAGGFALAWIITLMLWWSRQSMSDRKSSKRLALKRLREACANNNPSQANITFLQWALLQWPGTELLNLNQVAKLVHDTTLKKQLSLLSKALYSQEENTQWQGDELWRSLAAYLQTKPAQKNKISGLPPINPG